MAAGGLTVIGNTLVADTLPPDAGPFTFTYTVKNTGSTTILVGQTSCYDANAQISCSTSPQTFSLAPNATRVINGTFYTLGNGVHLITEYAADDAGTNWTSALGGPITVTGGAPIATNVHPLPGGPFYPWDTLVAVLAHPSGVVTSSVRLLIDGIDRTSTATVTSSSVKATAQALNLGPGSHTWKTRACAVSGRCDTATTVFGNSAPLTFLLDDSLPEPIGYEPYGPFLGGLPLPPENLRGCATTTDHPEMLLSPGQVLPQANPAGWVFTAGILTNDTLTIVVQYGDHAPGDGWPTCASLTWAPGFAWGFWAGADTGSVLWDYYPYSDVGQLFGAAPQQGQWQQFGQAAPKGAGPWRGGYGFPGLRGNTSVGGAKALRAPSRLSPMASARSGSRGWSTSSLKPPPGAIKFNTLQVSLNGVAIIANAAPARAGITINTTGFMGGQSGATIKVPPTDTLYHRRNDANPSAQQGGWNEVLASISDSTTHTTTVRSRFVSAAMQGAPASIALTPLRDFRKVDMSECAAFGTFQCGGVMVVQRVPGFMTRDRVRDLHLVYRSASQRVPVIAPHQVYIDPVQKAPDSMRVTPKVAGVAVGAVTRYAGLLGSPAGQFVMPLSDNMKEYRALAAEINPATGQAAIRNVTTELTHYYPGAVVRTDTVSQQVVQLYLMDTTATRFGRGWQLAELSRLVTGLTWQGIPALVWLDGDGSYSIFTKPASTWLSPPGETATLVENAGLPADSAYTIRMDNGATVVFRSDGWQAWTSDFIGNRTTYSYTGSGVKRLQYITDPTGARCEFIYNSTSAGRVDSIKVKPSGGTARRAVTLKYGATGRLDSLIVHWGGGGVRDATGFAYASDTTAGLILTMIKDPRHTDAKPVVTTFTYDSILRAPTYLTLPPYNYGVQGQQLYRDAWRRTAPRVWYGRGSLPLERTVLMSQLRGTSVNPAGNATDFTSDRYGNPTFVRRVAPAEVQDAGYWIDTVYRHDDRHIERDSLGRVVKIVHARDSAGPTTDSVMYRYDSRNRLDRIIRNTLEYPVSTASLDTLSFTYDSANISTTQNPGAWCYRLLTATDGAGGVTTTTYGTAAGPARCRPVKVKRTPQLDSTLFAYSGSAFTWNNAIAGRPTSIVRPDGVSTDIGYHATTWNTADYLQPAKSATTTVYYSATSNSLGRPDSVIDPLGRRTVVWYDSLGRVRYQKGGSGSLAPTTKTIYEHSGLVKQVDVFAKGSHDTVPAGTPATQTTKYFYDRLGQTDSVVNPGGTRRTWYYNRGPYGVPGRTYPGNGSYSASVTDWQGRIAATILSPVLPGVSYDGLSYFADTYSSDRYTAAGALTNGQLSDGQSYTYKYDVKGRQVETEHSEAGGVMSTRRRGYSRTGQLIADTLIFPQAGFLIYRWYQYNRRGQRILATDGVVPLGLQTIAGSKVGTIAYKYDSKALLDTVIASAGATTPAEFARAKFHYGLGNRDSVVTVRLDGTGNSLHTERRYDGSGRVTYYKSKKLGGASDFAASTSITYDKVDDALTLTRTTPSSSGVPMTYTYATDGTRRLLSETASGGLSTTWTYDVFGNRVKQAAGSVDTSGFEPTDNRLRFHRLQVGSNAHWYWHDRTGARIGSTDTLNGNATLDSRMTYTAAGQLAWSLHRQNPGDNLSYFSSTWNWYDGSGIREMTEVTQTALPTYLTLYPGSGNQFYYFYDGSDVAIVVQRAPNGALNVDKRYLTGGLDRQLAVLNGSGGYVGALAIVSDHLGSVVGAMRPNGNLEGTVASYSANAYGQVTGSSGSGTTNLDVGFAGASTPDAKGGFTYMRNRWYDPQTGRFLTQDPIGLAGGVNLYAYAGNNPVSFSDPYGLNPCDQPATSGSWLCQGIAAGKAQLAAVGAAFASAANAILDATTPIVDATRLLFGRDTDGSKLTAGGAALAAAGVFGGPIADKAGDGVRLWKKLANEELYNEAKAGVGAVIAGAGHKSRTIDDVKRLVAQYGGAEGDWAKMSTRTVTAPDGVKFSIHWYENAQAGVRTEFKTKIGD